MFSLIVALLCWKYSPWFAVGFFWSLSADTISLYLVAAKYGK